MKPKQKKADKRGDLERKLDETADISKGAGANNSPQDLPENVALEDNEPGEAEKLKAQCDEYLDKLQRLAAEYDNYRKRTTKERIAAYDNGVADIVEKLLPIVDNFERALGADVNKEDPFYVGVDMIMRQIKDMFASISVEELPALDQTFDPNIHFAVAHEEDPEKADGIISVVMQKGYRYKEKVVRHSMVKVVN